MKFVKFGILALSLGLFVASCGNGETAETPVDSTTTAPAPETPVTAPVDSNVAPVATDSNAAPATTPAADSAAKH